VSGFTWDPAWRDERLTAACTDVRSGIVGAAREVLAETWSTRDFARRGYASALLGALAAGTNLADLWVQDAPRNPDALLLAARVQTARAAKALRTNPNSARPLVEGAVAAIHAAGAAWPEDPTPWVVLLALFKNYRSDAASEPTIPELAGLRGPWELVERGIWARDAHNREAARHLLDYFGPRSGGSNAQMAQVAACLAQRSPQDSPLRLLPLAARIEAEPDPEAEAVAAAGRFNRLEQINELISVAAADLKAVTSGTWRSEEGRLPPESTDLRARIAKLQQVAEREEADLLAETSEFPHFLGQDLADLYAHWFSNSGGFDPRGPTGYVPLADVSLLAHGLVLAGEISYAAVVFRHLYPYASRYPWSLYGDPEQVLDKTLREVRDAGGRLSPH
jgi:hypothetical protein